MKQINKYYPFTINAHTIYNIEKKLAEKTYTKVESRDPKKLNNIMLYDEFIKSYPNLKFIRLIFKNANVTPDKINITNPITFIFFRLDPSKIERILEFKNNRNIKKNKMK